ncbi:Polycomb group protein FIE1 [Capsicum annuum]|nr:Polycomb group protein FIE1 [Capsicum annuum]
MAAKVPVGCEPVVGSLTPSKKKEYRVTNRLQEGKRPLYAVVFNFIDSRYFNVFATVGGNRPGFPWYGMVWYGYHGNHVCFHGFLKMVVCQQAQEQQQTTKLKPQATGRSKQRPMEKRIPKECKPVVTPLVCEPVVGSLTPSNFKMYKMTKRHQVGKRSLYAIVFNFIDARYFSVFAVAGGNQVTVYQCLEGGVIAVLQSYIDEDKDESFYTVSWACNLDGSPFLVAGGINGVLRVIDSGSEKLHQSFVGHGDSINEVRTQPLKPSLVVSASKDESVRLWNVHTGICIMIFAGAGGHRNEVLSVDFHPSDIHRIASCGMDNTVKIWSTKEFWSYVEQSFTWTDLPSKFPTKYVQFPSVDNEILLWEPKMKENSPGEGTVDILQKYPVPECDIWFIKFSCDFHYKTAAIGNREGKIFVWELLTSPPTLIARLSHVQSKLPIRQTAMSFDGSTILSCCEDGTIWRWDVVATNSATS